MRYRWRFFSVLPPIVLTYLFVTALAVGGLWSPTGEVQTAQRVMTAHLLPTLLFLLMVTCDLRAILKVGPRVLLVYACAMGSILVAIVVVYALFRGVLPQDGWKMLASLSATWTGTRYEGTLTGYSGQAIPVQITGWSSKAPMPTSRFALGAATLNVNGQDVVFAVGGASGNSLLNTVEAYDPATNTWSAVSSMPTRREGPGVVGVNGKLYVVGGNVSGGSPSGIVEVYDPVTNAWSSPLPPLSTPRSHFSLVAAGSLLYAIGGDVAANGTAVTGIVERLDLSQPAPAWTTLNPMPTPRRFTAAGALNNGSLIVVVGGQQVNGPALNRTELYSAATNQWTQGPNILAPTVAPASAVVQNALFVFGGFNNGALILAELYRPTSGLQMDGWAALSGMPTPRLEASAALVGDVIYVIGGQDSGAGQAGMSTLEAFSILSPDQFTRRRVHRAAAAAVAVGHLACRRATASRRSPSATPWATRPARSA